MILNVPVPVGVSPVRVADWLESDHIDFREIAIRLRSGYARLKLSDRAQAERAVESVRAKMHPEVFVITFHIPPSCVLSAALLKQILAKDLIQYRALDINSNTARVEVFDPNAGERIIRALKSNGYRISRFWL